MRSTLEIKKRTLTYFSISGLFFFILYACDSSEYIGVSKEYLFVDVSASSSGLNFKNTIDPYGQINIINYLYAFNGGGVGIADLDNDGLSDIVLTSNQGRNRIYFNKGDLQFEDGTLQSGLIDEASWSTGVTIIDINNDGLKDIYICNVNNGGLLTGVNRLYINQGKRKFVESASKYNLDISALSTQAGFFDYDRDGDLDIYLLCHSVHSPANYSNASIRSTKDNLSGDRLLKNVNGLFEDISESSGIYQSKVGYGLGLSLSDVNGDGWPDIYVANDFHENDLLYINQQDGTYQESSGASFSYTSKFSMGCDIADINQDGHVDIFTLDMKPHDEKIYKQSEGPDTYQLHKLRSSYGYNEQYAKNCLQLGMGSDNRGCPIYSEVSSSYGVDATDWSWSTLIEDYNLDGRQDIFITNGIYRRPNNMDYLNYISDDLVQAQDSDSLLIENMPEGNAQNLLFLANNESFFLDKMTIDKNTSGLSNGAAYGDLDNDGDWDLVINNYNSIVTLLENRSNEDYIKIDFSHLPDVVTFNAKIILHSKEKVFRKELLTTRGFQSCVETSAIFAMPLDGTIDSISIRWVDGLLTTIYDVEKNSTISPVRNKSQRWKEETPANILRTHDYNLNFTHVEDDHNDFSKENMLLYGMSDEGPAVAIGDVNGDGRKDLFLGGAAGKVSTLYIYENGRYIEKWKTNAVYEDTDAQFKDLDNDEDLDLIVSAGSGAFARGAIQNSNRIYINDGLGNFVESYYFIDAIKGFTSNVSVADVDGDGWQDIFFGSMSIVGAYGLSPTSRLLRNIRGKEFVDVPDDRIDGLTKSGMISDAQWADLDGDCKDDLIVVGHWMPVIIYWNTGEGLKKEIIENSSGLYNKILVADFDNDNLQDIMLGNVGLNHSLIGDDKKLKLFLNDFDQDSILDHIPVYFKDNRDYPIFHKDIMEEHFVNLHKSILTYEDYANRSVWSFFPKKIMDRSFIKEIEIFESYVLMNRGDRSWEKVLLPRPAQNAPIHAMSVVGDRIFLAGNDYGFQPIVGKMDVPLATVVSYNGKRFDIDSDISILLEGQVRHIEPIIEEGDTLLLFIKNDDKAAFINTTDK